MKISKIDTGVSVVIMGAIGLHFSQAVNPKIDLIVLVVVSILGALPVIVSAVRDSLKKEISMDLLASVALIFSIVSGEWLGASFIALMIASARILKSVTEGQAERSLKSLFKLRPEKTKIIKDGNVVEVHSKDLKIGDTVVLGLGDRVPIDGKVVSGDFSVDEASLTGESVPVDKKVSSKVFSSTIVVSGGGHILVEKVGKDTTLEKIISLLETSTEQKPKFQTIGEKFGKIYLMGIFVVAFVVFFFTHNTKLVLSVILVICADDVAVAVPLAYLSAVRRAAKIGAIVKGSSYLEALGSVDVMIFDKTGTLTSGHMKVESVTNFSKYSEEELLSYAGSLLEESNHPVSKAIYSYAKEKKVNLKLADDEKEVLGMGIVGKVEGKQIVFGRKTFLLSQKVEINEKVKIEINKLETEGKSNSFIVIDGKLAGVVSLVDEVKKDAKKTIQNLKKLGVSKIIMLTGDNEKVAKRVAEEIGIDEFFAGLLPEQKVAHIKNFIDNKKTVAMVGDGVNDAASLRMATVGVAMGAIGYDTAIESSDIVLMKDDIYKIVEIMKLSRFTRSLSVQDFWIWGISNVVGLSLVFGGLIGPSGAAAYNFLSDFVPLGNSLRKK